MALNAACMNWVIVSQGELGNSEPRDTGPTSAFNWNRGKQPQPVSDMCADGPALALVTTDKVTKGARAGLGCGDYGHGN